MVKLKDLLNEGPQRDMNVMADYIIDLNIELSNAKILAKKHDIKHNMDQLFCV